MKLIIIHGPPAAGKLTVASPIPKNDISCLGGGATYCLQQGVGPIQGLVGAAVPAHHQKHHPKRHEEARALQPSVQFKAWMAFASPPAT